MDVKYYKIVLIKKECTCVKLLGMYCKTYEKLIKKHLNDGLKLNEAQLKAQYDLGCESDCCLLSMQCPTMPFVTNRDNFSYINEVKESTISVNGYGTLADEPLILAGPCVKLHRPIAPFPPINGIIEKSPTIEKKFSQPKISHHIESDVPVETRVGHITIKKRIKKL